MDTAVQDFKNKAAGFYAPMHSIAEVGEQLSGVVAVADGILDNEVFKAIINGLEEFGRLIKKRVQFTIYLGEFCLWVSVGCMYRMHTLRSCCCMWQTVSSITYTNTWYCCLQHAQPLAEPQDSLAIAPLVGVGSLGCRAMALVHAAGYYMPTAEACSIHSVHG